MKIFLLYNNEVLNRSGALEQDIIDPNSTDRRRNQSNGCSRSYPVYCHMSYLRSDYLFLLSFLQIASTIWLPIIYTYMHAL
ncbi:unnamed protein product, partial [Brugia pahangi]|uniref:Ovule protein n=1 Tax=Brugia pahangi TaxID=6280 RepID=A0A0N4TFQ0_BRUPA